MKSLHLRSVQVLSGSLSFMSKSDQMSMGVLVQPDHPSGQSQREVPIPKKKWIKDYLTFGEKGFPDLPSNGSSSGVLPSPPIPNGYVNQHGIVPNGLHYTSQTHSQPPFKNQILSGAPGQGLQRVPESLNGLKADSYRRIVPNTQSPDFDFNGGTNRMAKSVSPSNISGLNNRNSGTREVHNKLEKNRRAHLKECFELLKSQLPAFEDRKISNLAILRSSLRHIQTLKRKEREFEHEMERLAREKIALQQRLSMLKKDMAGKWDHLDWRSMVPEGLDLDLDGTDGHHSPNSIEGKRKLSPNHILLENRNHRSSESSESNSPTNNVVTLPMHDMELDDSEGDSQHPLSLTVNNCHIADQKAVVMKKFYGQVNGVNGMSGNGPISLVTTTKLSSSPLAAITVEKTASSPIGGATYVSAMANNSGKKNGFSVLSNATLMVSSKLDNMGQYYEDEKKMCK